MKNILFLDIETVPEEPAFAKLSPHGRDTFRKRFKKIFEDYEQDFGIGDQTDQIIYSENVSIMAEYSKVACISVGYVSEENQYKSTDICGPDEKEVLMEFKTILAHPYYAQLCAHNGKQFDYPFLCRRMILHGIELPWQLKIMGLKPWDMKWLLDTQELWSLGDLRYTSSLDRLCYAFKIPSPKLGMDGSQVCEIFYSDDPDRFKKIASYCGGDVVSLVWCFAKMKQYALPTNLTNPV